MTRSFLSALGFVYLCTAADCARRTPSIEPEMRVGDPGASNPRETGDVGDANNHGDVGDPAPSLTNVPVRLSPSWGGGYPRVIRLLDGSLLGSVTAYQGGINRLRVTQSSDNGASFADIGEIMQADGATHDLDNAHIVQLHDTAPGATVPRLLAAFRNHDGTASSGYTTFRITVCRSDDGGRSWAYHSLVEASTQPYGLWEPFLFVAPDGSVQVYYARELAADNQDVVMRRSADGGTTWGPLVTVAGNGLTTRDGMPGVTSYWDGTRNAMMVIFESYSGAFQIVSEKSVDSGSTWTQRTTVYAPAGNLNAGAPQIAAVGARLVAVFMSDEDASQHNWPSYAKIKTVASTHITPSAVSWGLSYTIAGASSYWPGAYKQDDSSVFLTYVAGPSYLLSLPVAVIGR
ncbi:MAG: exo-alpha-sialidase [Deltaproteobacteria bacterium]|nr:MAG: exo-alpha-sialidase [Deltaproteobacteria bacterium]